MWWDHRILGANHVRERKEPIFQRALRKSPPSETVSHVRGCGSLLKAEGKAEYVMVQLWFGKAEDLEVKPWVGWKLSPSQSCLW